MRLQIILILFIIIAAALVISGILIKPVTAQAPAPQYECPYCVVRYFQTECNSPYCVGNPNGPHFHRVFLRCYDCETHQYYDTYDDYCSWTC